MSPSELQQLLAGIVAGITAKSAGQRSAAETAILALPSDADLPDDWTS